MKLHARLTQLKARLVSRLARLHARLHSRLPYDRDW